MPQHKDNQQGLVPQLNKEKDTISKLQEQFNHTVHRIRELKTLLAERKVLVAGLRQQVLQELQPLNRKIVDARVDFVKQLDEACSMPHFKKNEMNKLATLIQRLALRLIEDHCRHDMIPVHDKYAPLPYAEAVAQCSEETKGKAQEINDSFFGANQDSESFDELTEPEDGQEAAWQKVQDHKNRAKNPERKKTKTQLAKEAAMKAEMDNMNKASRRLYTDLAKQLHPDREQDAALKEWKEEEMKKVIAAYDRNDFFELLRLQMELLQEKGGTLDLLTEEQLPYYQQLLEEQLLALQNDYTAFDLGPEGLLLREFGASPKQVEQRFRAVKAKLRQQLKQVNEDLVFMRNPENIRLFLKQIH